MPHIKLSIFELVWRCLGRGRTPQRERGPHTKERCAEATMMRPFGGTITALGFSASVILMVCLSHTSKTVKKQVYASISA